MLCNDKRREWNQIKSQKANKSSSILSLKAGLEDMKVENVSY